jgi:short-subunit dehydrogenase
MPLNLPQHGPWALITGASDGIGRAFAQEAAAAGLRLVLVARRAPALDALAAGLRAAHGVEVRVIPMDLAPAGAATALEAQTRGLDIGLVVLAAGFGTSGPFLDAPLGPELEMIDLNCRSVAEAAHAFGPRLRQRGRGGLVLLSSLVAFQGVPRAANYAATKAWVQAFAEGLRGEWGPAGVDVLAVAPGPVRSGFAARAGMAMGLTGTPEEVARGALRALGRRGTARPGLLALGLEASLSALPRAGRVWVMSRVMAGMTPRPAIQGA